MGERVRIVADETRDKTVMQDGTLVEEKHAAFHLDAVSTTVAIDDRGHATRDHYDVTELTSDGKPLATGSVDVTRASREQDAVILVGGAPATGEVKDALEALLTMRVDGASDDDVFGTKAPQAIGAHWAVDTRLAHDDLLDDSGVDAGKVTGDAWLAGLTRANDADCLDVRATLSLDGLVLPNLPKDNVVDLSHADVDMEAALPFDGRLVRAADSFGMTMKIRLRVPTPRGQTATLTMTIATRRTARYSPG